MEFLATVLLTLALGGALATFAAVQNRKAKLAWQELASRFDLSYTELRVSGTNREVDIVLRTEVRGSGKNRSTWTVLTASLDSDVVPGGLSITREGLLAKVTKAIGVEDIDLEMPELDKALLVRGSNPAAVRAWAGRGDVARGLQDISGLGWGFHIHEASLQLEKSGVVTDVDDLVETVGSAISAARALSGKGYGALLYSDDW